MHRHNDTPITRALPLQGIQLTGVFAEEHLHHVMNGHIRLHCIWKEFTASEPTLDMTLLRVYNSGVSQGLSQLHSNTMHAHEVVVDSYETTLFYLRVSIQSMSKRISLINTVGGTPSVPNSRGCKIRRKCHHARQVVATPNKSGYQRGS